MSAEEALNTHLIEVEADLEDARKRLREIRYLLSLRQDPDFKRMMALSDDPEAGVPADELLHL